ncbi:hypothetical protein NIES4075_39730 [Tolypothrix sp. NIES-4075]|uniref:TMEM14 family protein n=1 Tax=Tolypothrix sp. NIES-4075 TaxID=2005459 RepID=UPI000B5CB160|nr:TMEM14 family protein [Tolypothrix sp. NIES-4075]GAX42967.1 hypothetical protein NIES4075_39730 [Tolypothrix sp. NIES-4075]
MNLGIIASLCYGFLAMVGGIIGYILSTSNVSLLSGCISGVLLLFAAYLQFKGIIWGLILAALVTAVLVVVFALRLAKTRKFMPAGLMLFFGVLTLAVMVNQLMASIISQ